VKLWAISDLHVRHDANRRALLTTKGRDGDWLLIAGDVGEGEDDLVFALDTLAPKFARTLWVPGNHELWTLSGDPLRGNTKYLRLVDACRARGVLTPEDEYPVFDGEGGPHVVAPLFIGYDYTFRPDDVPVAEAVAWAQAAGLDSTDEHVLFPDPYPSRAAWCHARVAATRARLDEAVQRHPHPFVLVNHYPLRQELAVLPRIPRFSIWCGTRLTHTWHKDYRAEVVVFGHLHIRQSRVIDGVRFEEVSLGYPRQWRPEVPIDSYFRQVLPAPDAPYSPGPISMRSGGYSGS
jgi:3',5'-cyclic AMP phosphodiesterase CpdA